MQKILYFLLFSFLSLNLNAQPYYVVSVKGAVSVDGKLLEKKDKIPETARLRFGSADAFAYVVSPGKGYFVLSPKRMRAKRENEFLLSLKEALLPPNEFNATSTRDSRIVLPLSFSKAEELQRFFRGDLLLITGTRFEVAADPFPLDEEHSFALIYSGSEADAIQMHYLPDSAGAFVIDEGVLSFAGQNAPPYKVSLAYADKTTGDMRQLGDFMLRVLPRAPVLRELEQLYEAVTPIPTEVFLRDHAHLYLEKVYGDMQPEVVRQLVEEAFGRGN